MTDDFKIVKERTDLADLILSLSGGRIVRRKGDTEIQINPCPICNHNDCFTVYNEERRYHCFSGSCGADGDCYDYIQITKSMDNVAALRFLAERISYTLAERPREAGTEGRGSKSPDSKHSIWAEAVEYYSNVLMKRSEEALEYQMVTRGHNADLLRRFGVGFSDNGLHRHLKASWSVEDMVASGLVTVEKDGRIRDTFFGGLFVYPHKMTGQNTWHDVGDWTCKPLPRPGQPAKGFRLKTEYRDSDCIFYNQPALYRREVILCEGQNDLLSLVGKGGFENVVATTGQITKDQLEAIRGEADRSEPNKPVQFFLCFDKDEAGDEYANKIKAALKDFLLPPRVHQLMPSYKYCRVNRLVWYSVHKDVDDYLSAIDQADESEDGKDGQRALERLTGDSLPLYQPLDDSLSIYRRGLTDGSKGSADPFFGPEAAKTQGEILFDWIGGKRAFFVDRADAHNVCFSHGGQVYRIDKNEPRYSALMYQLMKVTHEEKRGKIMSAVLGAMAHNEGRLIDVVNWFHQDSDGSLLLHSARRDEAIIRVSAGEVSIVPNGQSCLMRSSPQMHPIDYRPDIQVRKSMADLKRLVLDNLPCSPENRYFVMGWMLYNFLIGLSRDRPLLHVTGDSASGKTTLANLVAGLIYGNDEVTVSTVAAMWSDGSRNPVVVLDNLENDKVNPPVKEFLLAAATGSEKHKRSMGTNTGSFSEKLNCQVMITSIEPLAALKEMNNRLWSVECDRRKWGAGSFNKIDVLNAVKERRGEFISAWLTLISREVLPNWAARKKHWLNYLAVKQDELTKERMTEYFAGMLVILETVIRYMPDDRRADEDPEIQLQALVKGMFNSQRELSDEADTYANPIVTFLNTLADHLHYADSIKNFQKDFKIRVTADRRITEEEFAFNSDNYQWFGFRGTPTQYQAAFSQLAKQIGSEWPYKSVVQFGARLKDSEIILQRAGWTIEQRRIVGEKHYIITRTCQHDPDKPQAKLI